ncbi:MAG: phage baseplate assembly protein [Planctomycetota bacterium]
MNDITVKVNGNEFNAWKSIQVSKSITSIAGSFSFTLYQDYGKWAPLWDLQMGDEVTVMVGKHVLIKGFIEERGGKGGAQSGSEYTISGREPTGDLVDCSHYKHKDELTESEKGAGLQGLTNWIRRTTLPRSWNNVSLLRVVSDICNEFGITVEIYSSPSEGNVLLTTTQIYAVEKLFEKVVYQDGDTAFNTIARLCKQRAILPVYGYNEAGEGRLYLTNADEYSSGDLLLNGATDTSELDKIGHNVIDWDIKEDSKNRFSHYVLKSQASPEDNAATVGTIAAAISPVGVAIDYSIGRHRPSIIMSDSPGNSDNMKKLAAWEAVIRAGQSSKIAYSIYGWTQKSGQPWQLNSQVPIIDYKNNLKMTMLIDSVQFSCDSGGTKTSLGLIHPDAYKANPSVTDASTINTESKVVPEKINWEHTGILPMGDGS